MRIRPYLQPYHEPEDLDYPTRLETETQLQQQHLSQTWVLPRHSLMALAL
jgi:hypothetical protein